MPRIDLSELESGTELTCDICIVGSGPAGSTIASELSGAALDVVLLESGAEVRQPDADALNAIESVGAPREMDQWLVRNRIVGGSSHTWAGRCAPFDDIDFERRDWVPHSGWPITLADLRPYLNRSCAYLGLGIGADYTDGKIWSEAGRARPVRELDVAKVVPFFWQYSKDRINKHDVMRFARSFLDALSTNVRLVTNATVVRLNPNPAGSRLESIDAVSHAGSRHRITARSFVLCAGGIENARLLLCSNDVESGGVGNRNDRVGRFLMDHPRGVLANLDAKRAAPVLRRFGLHHVKLPSGTYRFRHGFRLSDAVQRKEKLLNCTVWLDEEVFPDDPWRSLRMMLSKRSMSAKDLFSLLRRSDTLLKGTFDFAVRRQGLSRPLKALYLVGMTEQVPDPASRITLSRRTDRLGVPIPRIDWKIDALEARSLCRLSELAGEEMARLGYEKPIPESWVGEARTLPAYFKDIAHPTGATRMAADPRDGVVDVNCRVHGVDGLFVVGSSVFPTAGHANPTQMIVALAIRAADHLKDRHGVGNPQRSRADEGMEFAHV